MGGRLLHSLLEEDAKYPYIIPSSCHFTILLIRQTDLRSLHGGVQLTLGTLRRQYWIIRGRLEVKKVIRACATCTRYLARISCQLMGSLPQARVCPSPSNHT